MFSVLENNTIQLTRGDTARLTVDIVDDKGEKYIVKENDVMVLTVKKATIDTDYCLQKSIKGSNTIHIEPKDTAGLGFLKYKYDVQMTTAEGDVYTVVAPSTFELLEEVTD